MPSWVETYVARRNAARAFLIEQGFIIQAARTGAGADRADTVPAWHVSGYHGLFSNADLVALAEQRGFDFKAVAA